MGLLPSLILGALIVTAFAFTAQQRLVLASPAGPMPARQIAYLMRVYHQSSVAYQLSAKGPAGVIANPPSFLTASFYFTSCTDGNSVVTFVGGQSASPQWTGGAGAYQNQSVVRELLRQSLSPPELGPVRQTSQIAGQIAPVPGIGLSTGTQIQSGSGLLTLPSGCGVAAGLPAIQTRVAP